MVQKLVAFDPDSSDYAQNVTALARSDPAFALRLMRLANAVSMSGHGEIDTIPMAMLRVGARPLAELITSLAVVEVFVPRTRGQRNLWVHALQVAAAARQLAQVFRFANVTPEQAYLAGLMHDIGRFLLFEHRPDELGRIDEADASDPRELIEAELRICGFQHAELGWHVCQKWSLPESVATLVRYHHVYREHQKVIPPEAMTLVQLVQEADCISFGLLRHPQLAASPDRHHELERLLRLLGEPIVPITAIEDHLPAIDRDSRLAAAVVAIAMDPPPTSP